MTQAGEANQGGPPIGGPRGGLGFIPYAVLALSVLISGVAAAYVGWAARARDEARFREQVEHADTTIRRRIDTYVSMLRSAAGLFAVNPDVNRAGFAEYVSRIDLRKNYPGLQGIGFSLRIPAGQDDEVRARLAREWGRPIPLWRDRMAPASAAPAPSTGPADPPDDRHAVLYLEPEDDRNRTAIGFDISSEAARRAALARARDTGQPAATGKLHLVTESDDSPQSGFLILVPVYRGDATPTTVEGRRAALLGFVYSPLRAGDLLEATFGPDAQRQLDFEVFDGADVRADARLYASAAPGPAEAAPAFVAVRPVVIEGRPWTLLLRTRASFEAASARGAAAWVLVGGLLVSAMLFVLTRAEARARRHAERVAVELEQSRQNLLLSIEARSRAESARRELLDRERQAREEAETANKFKDDFLATVSHELRTPLNAMLGWAQLLQQGEMVEASRDEAVEAIERNAKTQAQLIEDLLDISRIMRGKLQLSQNVPVDPAAVVENAIAAVTPSAGARDIEIVPRLEPGVGRVRGDPTRLQQVVWNLLSNSIKFSPDGGRIDVAVERRGGHAVIRVTDAGKGIAPEFLPHVFDRFRQADASTTRQQGGLGLGLAIVRNLVEMHGGTVEARSDGPGRGATFTVALPLVQQAPAVDRASSDGSANGLAPRVSLGGINVLVVDDDPDARRLVGKVLERHGARVRTAASAADALAALDQATPDVLLSDIGMPGEDGYALIAKVRARDGGRDIPAAALTAFAREEDRLHALEAGFHTHVAKPVQAARLVGVVAELANGKPVR
jgi:signal transduction histidine kinase